MNTKFKNFADAIQKIDNNIIVSSPMVYWNQPQNRSKINILIYVGNLISDIVIAPEDDGISLDDVLYEVDKLRKETGITKAWIMSFIGISYVMDSGIFISDWMIPKSYNYADTSTNLEDFSFSNESKFILSVKIPEGFENSISESLMKYGIDHEIIDGHAIGGKVFRIGFKDKRDVNKFSVFFKPYVSKNTDFHMVFNDNFLPIKVNMYETHSGINR